MANTEDEGARRAESSFQDLDRRVRETLKYARRAFFVAIAAVIVAIFCLLTTIICVLIALSLDND
jgi:hypothetical protein